MSRLTRTQKTALTAMLIASMLGALAIACAGPLCSLVGDGACDVATLMGVRSGADTTLAVLAMALLAGATAIAMVAPPRQRMLQAVPIPVATHRMPGDAMHGRLRL